jgi:nucleoside-diphosphate-sugar epimerase
MEIPGKIRRIFVTGGSGRTGRHLICALHERGYLVRAVTSREPFVQSGVEWLRMDWHKDISFDPMLEGCSAVLHLGAELSNIPKMYRANVEATEALAVTAERVGIRFLCYTSTISVYGSPRQRLVTEDAPLVTTDRDALNEHLAKDFLRAYARTKLLGEKRIEALRRRVDCVIVRPTVIVDLSDILAVGNWSVLRKVFLAYRHSHQIYVKDVVSTILWFMERSLANPAVDAGFQVYNLSNDDMDNNTHAYFLRKAYKATGDKRFSCPPFMPGMLDMLRLMFKYRSRDVRYTTGMLRYSPEKLYGTGYRYPFGILEAHERAIQSIGRRVANDEREHALGQQG